MSTFTKIAALLLVISLIPFAVGGTESKMTLPLEVNPEEIRNLLLDHTPLGSDPVNVMEFINSELNHRHKHADPYYDRHLGAVRSTKTKGPQEVIGAASIRLFLGEYGRSIKTLFMVSKKVYVQWAFDEEDKLIDIVVSKEEDGP